MYSRSFTTLRSVLDDIGQPKSSPSRGPTRKERRLRRLPIYRHQGVSLASIMRGSSMSSVVKLITVYLFTQHFPPMLADASSGIPPS